MTVLGPLGARADGEQIDLGGPRQRRVLAALSIDPTAVVTPDRLADRVWSDGDLPNDPRRTLRTYLTRLRQALGDPDAVLTVDDGWRLHPAVTVDAVQLGAAVERAAAPELDPHGRLAAIDEALDLFQGRPFGDLGDEEWVRPEAQRLEELQATLVERRYQAMLDAGKHTDAVPGLSAAVEANPLRDRLVGLQMLALYRTGRQAEATRAFQEHRARLADELGLEPGPALVDLDRRVVAGDPSLLLTDSPGRALRGYRLGEQIGEGAFAMVYRGTQPTLGRDVAVKVIRSELANRPEFIRRFEAEAHLVARLEHPRIVPLYDYWREPDRACLVFRYLRGGTLEARLTRSGPLSLDEAVQLADHVGSALAAAHDAGVVHRDVKPANVFLDEAGNYYLGDFGIALEATELSDPTAALSAGSPAYAAPEQLRRETIGPPADVHGLGVSLYEALTARLPFPDALNQADLLQRQLSEPVPSVRAQRTDLPPEVDDVLARATAKDPTVRYQSIDELVDALAGVVSGPGDNGDEPGRPARPGATTALSGADGRNPYKGLRAFTEADAGDFRGRERLVDRLVELLGRADSSGRIAAVVGPSGIGKSSVVRAGLLPALRRGAVEGSDRWFIATMAPGSDPFGELAAALLRVATHTPADLMSLLTDDERGIARLVKVLIPEDSDEEVLLVVDQFEELFTLVDDDQTRRRFLDSLAHAVTDTRCPLRVVLTMRADFWDRPLRYGAFARLIEQSTVQVTALAPDELERAITEPAVATGAEFEPGLVSEIAADVADQPGGLPLLQYALTELWERRVSGLLTRDAYRDLGGVAGALTRRADELFDESSTDEQTAVRRVFGRLITPGEGTEDTRRRALRAEVATGPAAEAVIDRHGAARLLSFDTDPATREPTVEVAHEALIREWPRLRGWLDEDRDGLRLHRHLHTTAVEWDGAERPPSELYRGGRLEAAEEYLTGHADELSPIETEFVDASRALREQEAAAERERFDAQVRNNRRLRGLLAGVGVLLVLALIAGGLAFQQRGRAQDQATVAADRAEEAQAQTELADASRLDAEEARDEAEVARFNADTGSLAAEAAARATDDPQLALLLAAEAYRRDPGPVSLGALQRVLIRTDAYLGTLGAGRRYHAVEWVADDLIVAGGPDGVTVFGADGEVVHEVDVTVADTPFYPGDTTVQWTTLLAAAGDHAVFVPAEPRTDLQLVDLTTGEVQVITHQTSVTGVTISPDGSTAFTLEDEGWLAAYDTTTGTRLWQVLGHPEEIGTDFGDNIAGLFDRGFVVISGQKPNPANDAQPVDRHPPKLTVSGDGTTLVTAEQFVVRRWQAATGAQIGDDQFPYVLVDSGAPALAAIDELVVDQTAEWFTYIWRHVIFRHRFGDRLATNANVVETAGGNAARPKPDALRLREDGSAWVLLTDGRVAAIDPATGQFLDDPLGVPLEGAFHVAPSPDERQLAVATDEGIALLALDGDRLLAEAVPRDGLDAASVNEPLGLMTLSSAQMLTFGAQRPRLFDIRGDHPVELDHPADEELAFFFDRRMVETLSMTSNFELARWDLDTGERLLTYDMPGSWSADYLSPDGRYLALADHLGIEVLEVETGQRVAVLNDLGIYPNSISISHTHLVAANLAGQTAIWAIDDWEDGGEGAIAPRWRRVDEGELDGTISVRHSPDGRWLATLEANGTAHLRDVDTLEIVASLDADLDAAGQHVFSFDEDGRYLLLTGRDNAQLWDIEAQRRIGDPFPNIPEFWVSATDGMNLTSADDDWVLYWNLDTDQWFDIACQAAGRNLTGSEWRAFAPLGSSYELTCPQWPAGPDADVGSTLGESDIDRSMDFSADEDEAESEGAGG